MVPKPFLGKNVVSLEHSKKEGRLKLLFREIRLPLKIVFIDMKQLCCITAKLLIIIKKIEYTHK